MHRFDPDEFLEVAEHLVSRQSEGSMRSAASRAYYGVFILARELAVIGDKGSEVHLRTQHHYEQAGERLIAEGLEYLRRRRNVADYLTERIFSQQDSRDVLKRSRHVRAALRIFAGRRKYAHAAGG
ncbi:hypothetical protein ACTJKJ_03530 [Roseateles sp. 22389]|uniref:hypothetical protein n=1 Tax=Roseateles sp. 22389 TaxID=3453916 RepID=UPI003F829D5C